MQLWYHEQLTYEITLDRDFYSRSLQIKTWLQEHMGPGLILFGVPKEGNPQDEIMWSYDRVFGHTFLRFRHEEDLARFQLTWC